MNLLLASIRSVLFLKSASCSVVGSPSMIGNYLGSLSATSKGTLDCCPLVSPLNTNDSILATNENDITRRFLFNAREWSGCNQPVQYNLYQHTGPNGAVSAILQILPSTNGGWCALRPGNTVCVEITLNEQFSSPNTTPLVYSFMCNIPDARVNSYGYKTIEIVFTYPNEPQTAIITISQLGYVNSAEYKVYDNGGGVTVDYSFSSDIFTSNPITGAIYGCEGINIENFLLPTNETTILQRLRHQLKKAARCVTIPESQLKNMSVAAFINELGCLFKCNDVCRPRPLCDQDIYVEYISFITSCIKCIAYCEETKPATVEICKPACSVNVGASCEIVNREIVECARRWGCSETKVCTEVSVMFGDIAPYGGYEAVCAGDEYFEESESSVICPDELFERSSSSETEELRKKEKKIVKKAPRKAVVKTKTTTSVSTYGWYAAAGVATITVAVVVYVFVL